MKPAKILLVACSLFILLIAFFPVGLWLISPLETQFKHNPSLPEKIDGIIVLSGSEKTDSSALWQQAELSDAAERYIAFIKLANIYPDAKLVFTGGSSGIIRNDIKATSVAKMVFTDLSFNMENIIFENQSRNTYENVILSRPLVNPVKDEKWLLITTAWHMPRSVGIFCQNEWPVIPYPVDHTSLKDNNFEIRFDFLKHLTEINIAVKEWVGLFAYYFSGKTTAILPEQC